MSGHGKKDQPDTRAKAYLKAVASWTVVRDTQSGTRRIREKASEYLPRHPAESPESHRWRRDRALLFNTVARTVAGLVGLMFRKPLEVAEAVADLEHRGAGRIGDHLEDVDHAGSDLESFARGVAENVLVDGLCGVMVDGPLHDPAVKTIAQERERGRRPHWGLYDRGSIINWRTERIDGAALFTLLVVHEESIEPDGLFGEKTVDRYRVLSLEPQTDGSRVASWALWEEISKGSRSEFEVIADGVFRGANGPLAMLPFVVMYAAANHSALTCDPPLEDLAHEALEHMRIRVERQRILAVAGVPMPVVIGVDSDESIVHGPDNILMLPAGAEAKYWEPSGASLGESRLELADIEGRMSSLGLQLLSSQKRGVESAEALRIERTSEDSTLASVASALEQGPNVALAIHAGLYLGLELPEAPWITLSRDFEASPLDAAMVGRLADMNSAGQISLETLWGALERGEILTVDAELERARIESDTASSLGAA